MKAWSNANRTEQNSWFMRAIYLIPVQSIYMENNIIQPDKIHEA